VRKGLVTVQQRPIRELMTTDVLTVEPGTCFKQVVRLLDERSVDAAPVVDADGRLVGVVSQSDLTCHEELPADWWSVLTGGRRHRERARKAHARNAADLMSSPARTVAPDTPVGVALREMARARVGRLVVVEDDRVVGILTRSDLLKAFLRDDDDIRHDVEAAIRVGAVDDLSRLDVQVRDGVVLLNGWIRHTSSAWAAAAAAREVEGVVAVEEDVLSDIDDTTVTELSSRGPFV
jgi:CBS domain-containing protein